MSFCTLFAVAYSCVTTYPPDIERVLKQAGHNRGELVKVLEYYRRNPADSLKLRAAEFLIANMPGKHSVYVDAPWNDQATVFLRWTSSSDKQRVIETFKLGEPVVEDDVTHITADYLINNIEMAFEAWRGRPWGRHVTFETFCEEILPYRISTEPLENWRAKVQAGFADLDTFLNRPTMTAVEACSRINSIMPRFSIDTDFPTINYSQCMATTRGSCDNIAAVTAFVMRALGVPVTVDFVMRWAEHNSGHSWNSVCDSAGRHISFMGAEYNPGQPHLGSYRLKSKAYRRIFAYNSELVARNRNENDVPPIFQDVCMTDISDEHPACVDLNITAKELPPDSVEYAYLAFFVREQFRWEICAYGYIDGDILRFPKVGKGIMYRPFYYVQGRLTPAAGPVLLDSDGTVNDFRPSSTLADIEVNCIEQPEEFWTARMVGGTFQGANEPDFSDAVTLHVIPRKPVVGWNSAPSDSRLKFRYVRYVSPKDGVGNVAEIEFLDANGRLLQGNPFSPFAVWRGCTGAKAFDGDPATFFDALEVSGAWTALDLQQPQAVSRIRYVPRNEGAAICSSPAFELHRWGDGDSEPQEVVPDANGILQLRLPENQLYYLSNKSIGRKGHLFTVRDGKMEWL
ncbi:MAG: hypothetical protein LBR06_08690 [Bacteroidales bacterium]|nr:hypothetical protein [Bacteroidales bacterium]